MLEECYASYVNLDKRPERREKMEKELRRVGITATRERGMLPEEYKGSPDRIRGMWDRSQKGAIGCYFSQLNVIEEAASKGRHAFVMEDDLSFCDDLPERLAIIKEFCSKNTWDVIWLGGTFHVGPAYWHKNNPATGCCDAWTTNNPRMIRTFGAFCTYAYIVNRLSIRSIQHALEGYLPQSWGIDHSFIHIAPKFYTYAFVPGCVIQYDHMSDIGHGETKFSNFKKLGPYWFQKRMTDFDPTTFDWKEAKR